MIVSRDNTIFYAPFLRKPPLPPKVTFFLYFLSDPPPGHIFPVLPGVVDAHTHIGAQFRAAAVIGDPQFRTGDKTAAVKVLVHLQILGQLCRTVVDCRHGSARPGAVPARR